MKFLTIFFIMIFSISAIAGYSDLMTVDHVNIERYLGKWYEIARFDQKFQKNCTAVVATYTKRPNGELNVINECKLYNPNGKHKKAIGRAWITDKNSNAKLKVQFFLRWFRINLFSGNYWIIDLDQENYSYAVVGDPSRKYLWILSRTKTIEESLYIELVARAREQGFETSNLLRTQH